MIIPSLCYPCFIGKKIRKSQKIARVLSRRRLLQLHPPQSIRQDIKLHHHFLLALHLHLAALDRRLEGIRGVHQRLDVAVLNGSRHARGREVLVVVAKQEQRKVGHLQVERGALAPKLEQRLLVLGVLEVRQVREQRVLQRLEALWAGEAAGTGTGGGVGLRLAPGGHDFVLEPGNGASLQGRKHAVLEEVVEDGDAILLGRRVQDEAGEDRGGVARADVGVEDGDEGQEVVVGHEVGAFFGAGSDDARLRVQPEADDEERLDGARVVGDLLLRIFTEELLEQLVVVGEEV